MPTIVEKWKVISPVESTNYVMNPSAETTSNYSALGAATVTRSTTYQKYGNYSYRIQTGSHAQGISLTLSTLPNENCFATARIRGKLPINLRFIIGNSILTPILIEKIEVNWNLYGTMFPALSCNGRTELRIIQQGNGIGDFYVDGVQVENLEYWTSYCDGDQPGCNWNGSEHAATSTRSALSREGGQVKDLYKDYGFFVDKVVGAGATTRDLIIDEYAILPGGELNEIKIQSREWSLIGRFIADSDDEIFQNRKDLLTLLKKNAQKQPTKFLFYHPKGIREIKAFYSAGLEGDQSVFYDTWVTEEDNSWSELNKYIEKSAIQLRSPDPYFYGQGNKSAALDANDSATFRLVAGRLKSTGQWNNLGPPGAPGIAVYTEVDCIAEDAQYVYFGGIFENFDNQANADYIVRYNKATGVYSPLGTGMNSQVHSLVIGPDGSLYAGGAFTTAGGGAANRVAKWNGTTWSALGTGLGDTVWAIVFGLDGTLYVTGEFTTAGGGAATRIAKWNGIGWSALGSGLNGTGRALAIGLDGSLYAGGAFTTAGGNAANRVAVWNGTIWSALGSGLNNTANAIVIDSKGLVYIGGDFTTAGGITVNYVTSWNGVSFASLNGGANNGIYSLSVASDDILYASGNFTTIGGINIADGVARWNSSVWYHLDIDLSDLVAIVYTILASKYVDPMVKQKYDIFIGLDTSATGDFNEITTVVNEGSVDVFPKFIFERNGGTTITLASVRNETTGKELLFNYGLLDGERLTIDLTPTKKSIISSFWPSPRLDAILPNSSFGDWSLEVGSNGVSIFAIDQFALYPSSLIAFVQWPEVYESYD